MLVEHFLRHMRNVQKGVAGFGILGYNGVIKFLGID